jgi:catalase
LSDGKKPPLTTTDAGIPAPSDEHSLTIGPAARSCEATLANLVGHMNDGVETAVTERAVAHWRKVDADLGERLAEGVGVAEGELVGAE